MFFPRRYRHPGIISLMKRAGCVSLNFGVESGDEQMLNVMKKGATVAQARQALRWSRELGFKTLASFLFGMPGETRSPLSARSTLPSNSTRILPCLTC